MISTVRPVICCASAGSLSGPLDKWLPLAFYGARDNDTSCKGKGKRLVKTFSKSVTSTLESLLDIPEKVDVLTLSKTILEMVFWKVAWLNDLSYCSV